MLARLIHLSVSNATLVVLFAATLLVSAGLLVPRMAVDVFPELNAPTVTIMTEAGGLAADEVEYAVTFPIESAMIGLPGTRRVRSSSTMGLSIVWVDFAWGADALRARQFVSERLASVRDALPVGAHADLTPMTSITGEIMLLALSSPDGSVSELDVRAFAEFDLRRVLLAVPGVAQVVAIGGQLPQYQILAEQDRLSLEGVSFDELVEAARDAHSTASAGYLPHVDGREIPLRQLARAGGVEDVERSLLAMRGDVPLTIGDVADVLLGPAPRRGTAADRGRPAVVVSIQKSPDANTLALTQRIDEVLDRVEAGLPAGLVLNRDPFRASRFIERSVKTVVKIMIEAGIIVVVILMLFLMHARATIITLVALPLSLAAAVFALWLLGLSINVMTLGGLAVAIGELVDDAIIDVENVLRRLKQNAALPPGSRRPVAAIVVSASNEIRSSMVFATIIICMVFVPLLFLSGLEGRFFRPLGIAYIVSIIASLGVALTITPALCALLLGGRREMAKPRPDGAPDDGAQREAPLARLLKRAYAPLLNASLAHRRLVLAATAVVAVASLALASTFGTAFLPTFREGTFTAFLFAPPGTSLEESDRIARGVEQQIVRIEGVSSVTRRTGRAERDEHAEPVSSSEIEITMAPETNQDLVREQIRAVLGSVPAVSTMIGQPMEHRLSHMLSGTPAAIAINIFGDDLAVLRDLAAQIKNELDRVPGVCDVAAHREVMIVSLPIRYRADDLAAAGLSPASAARHVSQLLAGQTVATIVDGSRQIDLVVRLATEERERIEQVMDLRLTGAAGAVVRLREVADIAPELTSNLITRENARRKAVVSLNIAPGDNMGHVVARVRERIDPLVAARGCTVHYGGQFEAQQSASRTMLFMGLGAAAAMFVLLSIATGRAAVALLVMLNLPLALIGGIAAVFITQSDDLLTNTLALFGLGNARFVPPILSIASLVGFVTLFGIAVRNGLLLVNHYRHVQVVEHALPRDAIMRGSIERLVPILMTALTAMLGLVPIALAADKPGSELLAPLAIVVLGGLVSSTVLNLFVVPAGYAMLARVPRAERTKKRRA